jgi:hypothetical protein
MKKGLAFALLLPAVTAFHGNSQTVASPSLFVYDNTSIVTQFSHNGLWGIFENRVDADEKANYLFDITNKTFSEIHSSGLRSYGTGVSVSDDGNIIAGSYEDTPAYFNKTNGTWTLLPMPSGTYIGSVESISADGHYGVGECYIDAFSLVPVLWDLTTNSIVETPGLIDHDMSNSYQNQNSFVSISADGRYIAGLVSQSYIEDMVAYVYDRETATYDVIGFTESTSATEAWVPKAAALNHIETINMSPDGLWIGGAAYMYRTSGEYLTPYRYNVVTKVFELYDEDTDNGLMGVAIDNNGVLYGATPFDSANRDMYVRSGKYWYSMEEILSQRYGINFADATGIAQTGTVRGVTGDSSVIGSFYDPSEGTGVVYYMNEPILDACAAVDLLGNYSVTPAAGAIFSTLSSVTINFDRKVATVGTNYNRKAELRDKEGNVVKNSMGISTNNASMTVVFSPTALNANEEYSVVIPAGTISLDGDQSVTNRDIVIKYVGRNSAPVAATSIYPTPGSGISKFDYSSSHILLNFDSALKLVEGSKAKIYRNDETDALADLSIAVNGNQMALYPTSTIYLYQGNTYHIEVPAGVVTDMGNSGANEAISIEYKGNYEREISYDDVYLFSEDFNEGLALQMMFYEGDNNVPTEEMQSYGFTATSTPWWIARDNEESSDYAAMSHSSYDPAGTSDDWMVIPATYLPDQNCRLTFDVQGFDKNKQDVLKVYLIPASDNIYNDITSEAITYLKANKKEIYNTVADPGATKGGIDDEWTHVEISLDEYAGQDVYIAFVNENTDQSIIFVDNVKILHEMLFAVTLDNETTVVDQKGLDVYGRISVVSDMASYSSANIKLLDSYGNNVDEINETNVTIDSKNPYSFRFEHQLPLDIGMVNNYKLVVTLDNETAEINNSVSVLAFKPTKRVMIEEYSGSACSNCPLGFLAMEKLQEDFGDQIIPVCLRTYNNDVYSSGLSAYTTYLGLNNVGAPSAVINRSGIVSFPMATTADGYTFFAPEGVNKLWCDYVYEEMETPAMADFSISAHTTNDTNTVIEVPMEISFAMDVVDQNISVLFIVLEDNLFTLQSNNLGAINDPLLGEWQKGGEYGSYYPKNVPYYLKDVARGVIGSSYNGTQGYVPDTAAAGELIEATAYVPMPTTVSNTDNVHLVAAMIDNNTDRVINAAAATIYTSGVETVNVADNFSLALNENGDIAVASDKAANVAVYNVAGELLGAANGEGSFVVSTNGYHGVVIVKAQSAEASKTLKFIVK